MAELDVIERASVNKTSRRIYDTFYAARIRSADGLSWICGINVGYFRFAWKVDIFTVWLIFADVANERDNTSITLILTLICYFSAEIYFGGRGWSFRPGVNTNFRNIYWFTFFEVWSAFYFCDFAILSFFNFDGRHIQGNLFTKSVLLPF